MTEEKSKTANRKVKKEEWTQTDKSPEENSKTYIDCITKTFKSVFLMCDKCGTAIRSPSLPSSHQTGVIYLTGSPNKFNLNTKYSARL